jgi:pilus assembly protein FimV
MHSSRGRPRARGSVLATLSGLATALFAYASCADGETCFRNTDCPTNAACFQGVCRIVEAAGGAGPVGTTGPGGRSGVDTGVDDNNVDTGVDSAGAGGAAGAAGADAGTAAGGAAGASGAAGNPSG